MKSSKYFALLYITLLLGMLVHAAPPHKAGAAGYYKPKKSKQANLARRHSNDSGRSVNQEHNSSIIPSVGIEMNQPSLPSTSSSTIIQIELPSVSGIVSNKLLSSRLLPDIETQNNFINKQENKMLEDITATANKRGRRAYRHSFGKYGLGARTIGAIVDLSTDSSAMSEATFYATAASKMALNLSMPMAHAGAAANASVGEIDTSYFVQPDPANPIAMDNLVGKSFSPFRKYLSAGNTVLNTIAQTANIVSDQLLSNPENQFIPKLLEHGINTVGLYGPGDLAGRETARNIASGQLALGFSLSQPVTSNDTENEQVRVIVHQEPLEKSGGLKEVGYLTIEKGTNRHKISAMITKSGEFKVVTEVQDIPTFTKRKHLYERMKSSIKNIPGAIKNIPGAIKNIPGAIASIPAVFTPTWQTTLKTAALASTLVESGFTKMYLLPLIKDTITASTTGDYGSGRSLDMGAEGLKLLKSGINNAYLGGSFIPKFETFTEPIPETKMGKAWQLAKVATPFLGTLVTHIVKTNTPVIPGLVNKNQFSKLVANKADTMSILANVANLHGDTSPAVSIEGDEFIIDTTKLLEAVNNQTLETRL